MVREHSDVRSWWLMAYIPLGGRKVSGKIWPFAVIMGLSDAPPLNSLVIDNYRCVKLPVLTA